MFDWQPLPTMGLVDAMWGCTRGNHSFVLSHIREHGWASSHKPLAGGKTCHFGPFHSRNEAETKLRHEARRLLDA